MISSVITNKSDLFMNTYTKRKHYKTMKRTHYTSKKQHKNVIQRMLTLLSHLNVRYAEL